MIHVIVLSILHPHPPRFRGHAMEFVVPLKFRSDGESHTEYGARDWLDGC